VGPRPPSDGRRAASGPLSTEGSAAVSGWARGSGSEKGAYKEPKTVAYQNKPDIDAAYARL
jgi:proline dehydrogenase